VLVKELVRVLSRRLRGQIGAGAVAAAPEALGPIAVDAPAAAAAPHEPAMESLFHLRGIPLFAGLDAEQLLVVADIATQARFSAGETIFEEGSAGEHLYLITEGTVEVVAAGEQVAVLAAGECFGEMAVLDHTVRSATVRALADTTALAIAREDFGELLDLHPALARSVMTVLSRRVRASLTGRG
jgi:CRP-like cAMP-binding protein